MNDQSEEDTTTEKSSETQRQDSSEERPRKRRTTSETSSRAPSKSSASRSASGTSSRAASDTSGEPKRTKAPARSASSGRISAVQVVKKAVEQFGTLTGRAPESVVGARWDNEQWIVRLEVVESRRIPDSADLLAEYEVELDGQGELLAYSRNDRYVRGRPSE